MLFILLTTLLAATIRAFPYEQRTTYEGFKVLRVLPENEHQLGVLRNLQSNATDLDFWTEPSMVGKAVDVMVSPNQVEALIDSLQVSGVSLAVLMDNVQRAIEEENPDDPIEDSLDGILGIRTTKSLSWSKYHRTGDIHGYLDQLASTYSDIASTFTIGKSFEGRPLKGIKIGKPSSTKKPAIWIDAGIHAREWIAPAVATYIISQLLENYDSQPSLVDNVDWYILPLVNPDGYEYTHTNMRMWRKTRSIQSGGCRGVDGNRNFGFHWMEGGASSYACSDTYAGPRAFSEVETKSIADFLTAHKGEFQAFLSIHAYGQMWLSPWGYTANLPSDYNDLMALAKKATNALTDMYGTRYRLGTSTNVLYIASGGSDDWAKGVAGIKYSYTMELRDSGSHGFVLPASQILPTGRETWEAIKVVGNHIMSEN